MSTIVYRQASQPSMDSSHVVEATTMRLKLVSPKSCNQKTLFGGWSFLQSPSSQKPVEDSYIDATYLHNQSLKLSQKSLELCTERLGSESGSDTSEDDAIFTSPASSLSVKRGRREPVESKKVSSRSFPPPLTTMSGSKPFQVRPHREGGRLIIEAMETSLGTSCLRAERSHGRLRLTCWKSEEGDCDTKGQENDMNDVEKSEGEMERNVVVENFQRLRRCNEDEHGDKGICCHWEPASCWVATS
ncbi:protein FANTASTIC FOUR 3-like [Cynara cardunculus var. scolymus]|uniref:FAF domain-containing protein n=1 Tax=Cynara cardunculus var. scolymus TaxID=59895 RepID=A0A103Y306_CYNCS|nr:protein FANTASTIC FOUR 3-like [Cynara cardunculus var. scolymus]KVI01598.1 Protein of unknown function DUF3049 [Cynara cardunculus var. scolymus]